MVRYPMKSERVLRNWPMSYTNNAEVKTATTGKTGWKQNG